MKISDWDERRLEPLFGHQGTWLTNDLDRLNSPIAAAFALVDEPPTESYSSIPPSRRSRRFLVASELGLMDARYTPGSNDHGSLRSRLIPWPEVGGVALTGETTLDEALRHTTRWRLTIQHPALEIDDAPDDDALIEFWRECVLRAKRPPTQEPEEPE
jgi:hypothetical protein